MTDTPWEPPLASTEAEQLLAALDRLRATFRYKADGLDASGLGRRIGASTLTLGGLLKHLALAEDNQFGRKLTGAPLGRPAAAGVRHDRGVRPPHRARRPDQGGGGRADRRGPGTGLEADLVK